MFYLSENVTENFFNHQQWWKEMKKQMNPSKSTSAKSKAGTNYTKTYKLNCQFEMPFFLWVNEYTVIFTKAILQGLTIENQSLFIIL